jgi:hypothetical protein
MSIGVPPAAAQPMFRAAGHRSQSCDVSGQGQTRAIVAEVECLGCRRREEIFATVGNIPKMRAVS